MISVLHVLNKFDLSEGGPPRSVYNLILGLNKLNIKTYLISSSKKKKYFNNQMYIGNNLIDRFSIPSLQLINELKNKIKLYDIIHVHCMWNVISSITFLFAKYYKKKIIFSPHGTMDKNNLKKNYLLKKIYHTFFEKYNISKIDLVHFLNHEEKKNSKLLDKKKSFVSNNGLNLNEFKFPKTKKSNLFSKKFFNILNIGRFDKIKGIELQFELIKILNLQSKKFKLTLIGPNDSNKLFYQKISKQMKISKYIKFISPIYSNRRFKIMHDSDLLINTSNYECNSMVIMEAIASGALVLAVENANISHQHKFRALIKTKRNIKNISDNITLLVKNPKIGKKIRNTACRYAKKHLNIDLLSKNFLNEYIKLANTK